MCVELVEWVREAGGQLSMFSRTLCPQDWVLVEGLGESCCHCAPPGEWSGAWQRTPKGRRMART